MRIMIDGHGLWSVGPALEISRALAPFEIEWVEDLALSTDIRTLQRLRRKAQFRSARRNTP
jgi:L-alanine-DL-glutamate epimerase-like enolase superfamily enzyme